MARRVRGSGEAWLRGAQTVGHTVAMIWEVLLGLSIPVVIWAALCLWLANAKSDERVQTYGIQSIQAAAFDRFGKPFPELISIRGLDGVERTYANRSVANLKWIQPYAETYRRNLRLSFGIWLLGTVAIACFTTFWFIHNGREKLKERFIRGQAAVPLSQLIYEIQQFNAEEVKRLGLRRFRPVKLIGVPYPYGTEHEHSLTVGSPGSGKSQAIHELLESIRARGDRAIIYDSALEFTTYHFNPDTDVILNPYDARAVAWSPYNDATDVPSLEKLATCIFKEPKGGDPYWTKATRQVFTYAAYNLKRQFPDATLDDLLRVFFGPMDVLAKLLEGTPAATHMAGGSNGRTDSLRSVLAEGCNSLVHLAGREAEFSLRAWVNRPEKSGGFLFLSAPETHIESLRPLLSFWSDLVVSALLGRLNEDERHTTWIILDEFPSLGKVASLASGPERLRKFGGAVFLGLQQFSQIQDIYGHEVAQTIIGQCATKLILRCQDPETAKYMSEQLGRHQTRRVDETVSYGANSLRDGVGLTPREELEPIALPDEVMNLPKFHGFIRVSSARAGKAFPISTIKFAYKARERRAPGLVLREGPSPIDTFFSQMKPPANTGTGSTQTPAQVSATGSTPASQTAPQTPVVVASGPAPGAPPSPLQMTGGSLHDGDGVVVEEATASDEGARSVTELVTGEQGADAGSADIPNLPPQPAQRDLFAEVSNSQPVNTAPASVYAQLVARTRQESGAEQTEIHNLAVAERAKKNRSGEVLEAAVDAVAGAIEQSLSDPYLTTSKR